MASVLDSIEVSNYVYKTGGSLPDGWIPLDITITDEWKSSGFYAESYRTPDGEIVVVYAGTNGLNDVDDDILLTLHQEGKQVVYAKEYMDTVQGYVNSNQTSTTLHIAGHSLGGHLASKVMAHIKLYQDDSKSTLYDNTEQTGLIINAPSTNSDSKVIQGHSTY